MNLPMHPNWKNLSERQRDHAGRLNRRLEDATRGVFPGESTETHPFGCLDDDYTRPVLWYFESLLVALTHRDPKVAFRAFIQAARYSERLSAAERDYDAERVAQNRVDDMLPDVLL